MARVLLCQLNMKLFNAFTRHFTGIDVVVAEYHVTVTRWCSQPLKTVRSIRVCSFPCI